MITYHPVGETTLLRFLLIGTNGLGNPGQTPVVAIKRRSDSKYWTGVSWQVGYTTIGMTEEDPTNLPGSYFYSFNQASAGGSNEEYLVRYMNIVAMPNTALDEEQHSYVNFATSLTPPVTIGHALSDDGTNFYLALWVEVGGQRVTNYTSLTVQLQDDSGDLVANLGSTSAQTAAGVFAFQTPIVVLQRNTPYILIVQATQGIVTSTYNLGVVRV